MKAKLVKKLKKKWKKRFRFIGLYLLIVSLALLVAVFIPCCFIMGVMEVNKLVMPIILCIGVMSPIALICCADIVYDK